MKSKKVFIIITILLVVFWGYRSFKDYKEEKANEELIESIFLSKEEKLLLFLKNEYNAKGFLDEFNSYINKKKLYDSMEVDIKSNFEEEDFNKIKEVYKEALQEVYLLNDDIDGYSINDAIKEVEVENNVNGTNISNLLLIQKELVEEDIYNSIFTRDVIRTMRNATRQLERIKLEENIHAFMKETFNQITNYGDNYNPDIHDEQIANLASEKYRVTPMEAQEIFIRYELK